MSLKDIEKYIPVSETTYYILLALTEPLHGYAVIKKVEEISEGMVRIGAGTLYNAFSKLTDQKLIQKTSEDDRRKFYVTTDKGKELLAAMIQRYEIMTKNGAAVKSKLPMINQEQ